MREYGSDKPKFLRRDATCRVSTGLIVLKKVLTELYYLIEGKREQIQRVAQKVDV